MRVQAMTATVVLLLTAAACSPAEEKAPAPAEARRGEAHTKNPPFGGFFVDQAMVSRPPM